MRIFSSERYPFANTLKLHQSVYLETDIYSVYTRGNHYQIPPWLFNCRSLAHTALIAICCITEQQQSTIVKDVQQRPIKISSRLLFWTAFRLLSNINFIDNKMRSFPPNYKFERFIFKHVHLVYFGQEHLEILLQNGQCARFMSTWQLVNIYYIHSKERKKIELSNSVINKWPFKEEQVAWLPRSLSSQVSLVATPLRQ